MENKKSFSDVPKESPKSRIQMEKFVEHIYTDMLLNEILLNKKREELLRKIDHVLDLRDKEQFMHLTNELKKINLQFG
ncbi:IDEAL domain-containing protein [Heyndrickxia coagulans]|uniref:IDEAL domain-containing protein n=1 Tax=Heyndrickxia coagulans TaxID=1398 RepID=UPI0028F9D34F|nr:IDEAL domain-containing protein [Heyndrickxia coagulans]MDT9755368.1 IDEAL domain-containing protein [Heyndrickxia coagulans]